MTSAMPPTMGVVLDSGSCSDTTSWRCSPTTLVLAGLVSSNPVARIPSQPVRLASTQARFFGAGNETQQRPNVAADGTIQPLESLPSDGAMAWSLPARMHTFHGSRQFTAAAAAQCGWQSTPAGRFALRRYRTWLTSSWLNGNLERDAGRASPFYQVRRLSAQDDSGPKLKTSS